MAKITKNCINLVKEFEGCYLKAYRDEVGTWTVGYGITNSDKSITNVTIEKGLVITQKTADIWLERALTKKYLPLVIKYNKKYNWNQNQIDALVSFCYNIGSISGLTANGTRSNKVIAEKMLAYNKAGGKVYRGLTRRRQAEHALFIKKSTYATVNTKTDPLTIRCAANASAKKIGKIPKGIKVNVVKKGTTWTKVNYKNVTGYVATKYLKF